MAKQTAGERVAAEMAATRQKAAQLEQLRAEYLRLQEEHQKHTAARAAAEREARRVAKLMAANLAEQARVF